MPAAAKAHTKAGAEAFVRYFWDVVNYAQKTGETSPLHILVLDGCETCQAGISGIESAYEATGHFEGGENEVGSARASLSGAGTQLFSTVVARIHVHPGVIIHSNGDADIAVDEKEASDRFELIAIESGWLVSGIKTS